MDKEEDEYIQLEIPQPTEEDWIRYENWKNNTIQDSEPTTEQDLNDSYKIEFEI